MDNEKIKKTEEANPPLDPDSLAEPEAPDEIVTETDTSVAEEGAEEKKSVIRKFFPKKEKPFLFRLRRTGISPPCQAGRRGV